MTAASDKQDALKSFVDVEGPQLVLADRSLLEAFATCPAQARFAQEKLSGPVSEIAVAGNEVHAALGRALSDYIASGGVLSPSEIAEEAWMQLRSARPDVQPDAIAGAKASVWAWSRYVGSLNPVNILRFDGGEGGRSGQLAIDMPGLGVRVTSEIDLLHAGPSKELLHEVDYKAGHAIWTARDVAESFQFQCHAWLVLENYPLDAEGNGPKALEVKVWNLRSNKITWSVEFPRSRIHEYKARVASAAMQLWQHRNTPAILTPTWPSIEKCELCDAAALCPVSGQALVELATDPAAFVRSMIAVEAKAAAMVKLAKAHVKTHGTIQTEDGDCFGVKPASGRAPLMGLFKSKEEGGEE